MTRKFVPYANEADVLTIGGLTIENRLDRITIDGDIDLTMDKAGLTHARELYQLLGAAVARLEAQQDLPATLPAPQVKKVGNPFG
ncbi:hypothetical protein IP92_03060 [Pseudoduganella flava]|uniref:Uncharacterized protein n=1 Tax=Pseudoduganella flava TaxID=871742 RepID=A0A562PQH3_9BURK|nr:hypothetical protein [Pseudoduganella flava]QGZ37867.1 hypothetical protein GO485_01585 [Pseudoduganella flava]TWI46697.1 hypothetical protein IP92_03060 [Pseudoduganella flava]